MARTLCVSYDLKQPSENYDELYDYLKGFTKWCHALESVWFIVTDKNASTVRDELKNVIDTDDKVLVFKASVPWASRNLGSRISGWLKSNL